MGLIMSLAAKGLPTAQVIDTVMRKFQEEFEKKDTSNLEGFHEAILDMFAIVNSSLPGKHWCVPQFEEIKACFNKVEGRPNEEDKKKEVLEFLKNQIKLNKSDNSLLIIGLATPPAAMVAKKAGEGVPQLKFIKSVPDVLFVPATTLLALVSVKFSRSLSLQKTV